MLPALARAEDAPAQAAEPAAALRKTAPPPVWEDRPIVRLYGTVMWTYDKIRNRQDKPNLAVSAAAGVGFGRLPRVGQLGYGEFAVSFADNVVPEVGGVGRIGVNPRVYRRRVHADMLTLSVPVLAQGGAFVRIDRDKHAHEYRFELGAATGLELLVQPTDHRIGGAARLLLSATAPVGTKKVEDLKANPQDPSTKLDPITWGGELGISGGITF